jgi:hypothetical protein
MMMMSDAHLNKETNMDHQQKPLGPNEVRSDHQERLDDQHLIKRAEEFFGPAPQDMTIPNQNAREMLRRAVEAKEKEKVAKEVAQMIEAEKASPGSQTSKAPSPSTDLSELTPDDLLRALQSAKPSDFNPRLICIKGQISRLVDLAYEAPNALITPLWNKLLELESLTDEELLSENGAVLLQEANDEFQSNKKFVPHYIKYHPNIVGLARAITSAINSYQGSWVATGPKVEEGYYRIGLEAAIATACSKQWYGDLHSWERLIFILLLNSWRDARYWAEDVLKFASGGSEIDMLTGDEKWVVGDYVYNPKPSTPQESQAGGGHDDNSK